MDMNAAIAMSRFGLGHRRDQPLPDNAKAWLRSQLTDPDTTPSDGLMDTAQALALLAAVGREQHEIALSHPGAAVSEVDKPVLRAFQQRTHAEQQALLANALVTATPFRERLVWFWANHFTVATKSRPTSATAGPYVREAIRPHVTGRFGDMLLAVMRHPCMLGYLDQAGSVGPNSPVGLRKAKGLNENLARECLELHTVTPACGYTQADVTNFAKVLTGWSFRANQEPLGFVFKPETHEPGEQTVMGRRWPDGEEGGVQLLAWLATHPATYHHLAVKLVRHFVADTPDPADVAVIENTLRNTQGDLGAAAQALIELPHAWEPLTKLRTPQEYVVAVMRAVGAQPDYEPKLVGMVDGLGQGVFKAPFPIGWPDRAADWASPEAILQRVDFAYQFSARVSDQDPVAVAQATLGPLLRDQTLAQIKGAGSRQDALTLLFACPEFQRR
jgi:uncharacterized protein (DUF1800 family)